jgi:transcriptional regulator with XRE-family HTH domain
MAIRVKFSTKQFPVFTNNGRPINTDHALRFLREERGMTRAELAAAMSVSARSVEAWEQGRPISDAMMCRIAAYIQRK